MTRKSCARLARVLTVAALAGMLTTVGGGQTSPLNPNSLALQPAQTGSRFIVTYRDSGKSVNAAALQALLERARQPLGVRISPLRRLVVGADLIQTDRELDRDEVERLVQELSRDPNVEHVSIDALLSALHTPNDPRYSEQWHYHDTAGGINVERAWDISTGEGVVVAVLDTGITDHPDLDANILPGYDFISEPFISNDGDGRDPDAHDPGDGFPPSPSSWHGTHVTGTIAASTNNGVGVAGVAFGARVQPVRVLGLGGGGFISDILEAIVWASGGSVPGVPDNPTPADVINLSLGGYGGGPDFGCDPAVQAAITLAINDGTTVVAAAGNNSGRVRQIMPANCDGVIAVAATGPSGERAFYSNYGELIDVAAPGGSGLAPAETNILSTLNTGQQGPAEPSYGWYAGTSMSSPHVAGVVALIQSASPVPRTPADVREIITNTAYNSGAGFPGGCTFDINCGPGILDARYAVAVAAGLEPLPPPPPEYPPLPDPVTPLANGVEVTGISAPAGGSQLFSLEVPPGAQYLTFVTYGGTGESLLLLRRGKIPSRGDYDCGVGGRSNDHVCAFAVAEPGTYYVRLHEPFRAFSGITLYATFVDNNWPRNLNADARNDGHKRLRVTLTWESGDGRVDVYRNGAILKTVHNTGTTADAFPVTGGGVMEYKVCNNRTQECSPPVTIEY